MTFSDVHFLVVFFCLQAFYATAVIHHSLHRQCLHALQAKMISCSVQLKSLPKLLALLERFQFYEISP